MLRHGERHVDSAEKVGQRIRRSRGSFSQRQLAKMVGVSAAYISRLERGERIATLQLLERMADALGVDLDWLRGRSAASNHHSNPLSSTVIAKELETIEAAVARIRSHLHSR